MFESRKEKKVMKRNKVIVNEEKHRMNEYRHIYTHVYRMNISPVHINAQQNKSQNYQVHIFFIYCVALESLLCLVSNIRTKFIVQCSFSYAFNMLQHSYTGFTNCPPIRSTLLASSKTNLERRRHLYLLQTM